MRRQRLRCVGVGAIEHHAVRGQQVDCRSLDLLITVRRQLVGTERIDRDDDDGTAQRGRSPRVAPASGRRERGAERDARQKSAYGGTDDGPFSPICPGRAVAASSSPARLPPTAGSTSVTIWKYFARRLRRRPCPSRSGRGPAAACPTSDRPRAARSYTLSSPRRAATRRRLTSPRS